MIDVTNLKGKLPNEQAEQYVEENAVAAEERVTSTEWNTLVNAVGELQEADKKNVKNIKFNGRLYPPVDGVSDFNQSMDADTYAVRIASNKDADKTYVIKSSDSLSVGVRYMAVKITTAGDRLNYRDVPGTLTVARSADGVTYGDEMDEQSVTSVGESSTDYPITLDLGKYAELGMNYIRVTIKSSYTDDSDVVRQFQNTVVYVVNSVNLTVKNLTDYTQRILASDGGFPFSFAIMGAVKKYLHIKVSGAIGTWTPDAIEFAADVQRPESNPYSWTQSEIAAYGILSHGVHTVEAWLTCENGLGGNLESDHIVNRYMVVNQSTTGADLQQKYLLLQGVKSMVTNYVRTVISQFAIWSPDKDNPTMASTDAETISVRITNAGDGDTDYQSEYYRSEMSCVAGQSYDIDTTVEIENTTDGAAPTSYQAYLRMFRYGSGNSVINFMYESIRSRFQVFTVDNSSDYSPIAGSHFYLNPRVRNNSETNWNTIINQQTSEAVPSTWTGVGKTNEGWTTDSDGVKVLRVLAKHRINIGYEPFEAFLTNKTAAMSIEMEFAVRNITKEDEPVIDISQYVQSSGERLGVRILPLTGALWAQEKQTENDQDFGFEEDERVHMIITFNPAMVARSSDEFTWQTPNGVEENKPTAKVYINSKHKRAVQYSVEDLGVWVQGTGHGGITIGNDNADVDIYSIRVYRGTALSPQNVVQNYIASRPTAEEKNRIREENNILDGNGRVSMSKLRAKNKRTLTWVGTDNYKINQDTENGYAGYWDIYYCDDNGTYIPELSGTICKASYEAYLAGTLGTAKCLLQTAQGSTANTYWWNNGQTKTDKVTFVINIPFSTLHDDFGWTAALSTPDADGKCSNPMYYDGSQITPTQYNALQQFEKDDVTIDVIDGWIDGNGKYHGQFYTSYVGGAKSQKLVNKINVASPQQSHKMGATRLYNDIMKIVTDGGMDLHKSNSKARFSVYEDSFYYFNQPAGQASPVYVGISTFGQGKADKAAWGYSGSKYPNMAMFEGANNNLPLVDFIVPMDDDVVYKNKLNGVKTESYCYNGVKSFEFALGNTTSFIEDGEGRKRPTTDIENIWKRYVNFIYTHDVRIELFRGTRTEFDASYASVYEAGTKDTSTEAQTQALDEMQKTKYWIRDGIDAFHLLRFNFITGRWVDAGTWDQTTKTYSAGVRNLSTDSMTSAAYQQWLDSEDNGDYAALNTYFKRAIAQHFNDYFGTVGHVVNHKTHYNLVNHLLAGTDNCSKNTYYVIDHSTGLVWLYQDDLDTIFKTDNNGRQTKVYFLSRFFDKYDFEHGYKSQADYEGSHNALFNTIEYAWEEVDNTALASNMRSILTAMSQLVSSNDKLEGLSDTQKQTPWGCINKYFFSIQKYFPANAYNEQQRIRYDWPASFGYESYGNQARGVLAVTQGIGDQLESERQYMKRRLALVCSYAAWGDFSAGVNTGSVGLDDTSSAFSLTPGSGRTGGEYTFVVKPHQFIYPCGSKDRALVNPHVRVAPGESYSLTIATAGNSVSGDSSVGLAAINYYRSIGNVGNMVAGNNTITVQGKRLTEFVAEPSVGSSAFAPGQIQVTANNLQKLSFKGLSSMSGTLSLTSQQRLTELDLRGTNVSTLRLPDSSMIEKLQLGGNLSSLTLRSMPCLSTCSVEGYNNMTSLYIGSDITAVNIGSLLADMYEGKKQDGAATMQSMSLYGLSVPSMSGDVLKWMMTIPSLDMTGYIEIYEPVGSVTPSVNFDMKLRMIQDWGVPTETVDSNMLQSTFTLPSGSLSIKYRMRSLSSYWSAASVTGDAYTHHTGEYTYKIANLNAYCNAFKKIQWAMTTDNLLGAEATINSKTGVMNVTKLSVLSGTTTVSVTVTPSDGISIAPLQRSVGLYDRLAVEGDIVYADGTYGPVSEHDAFKTVVGLCCYAAPRDVDGNILTQYANINDKQLRLCVCTKDITGSSSLENGTTVSFATVPWGPYRATDAANGLYYLNGSTKTYLSDDSVNPVLNDTSFYDLAGITNFTATGLTADSTNQNSASYIGDNNMRDISSEDGWKHHATLLTCINDGFAYGETNADSTRKLDAQLAVLAGSSYQEGDIVNKGYANTLKIIQQRNNILGGEGIAKVGLSDQLTIPTSGANTTELQDLYNGMTRVRDIIAKIQGGSGSADYTNTAKWSQLYFPAASVCYAYEPTVKANETLSDKFKKHNWFLPTIGLLMRLYWTHRMRAKSQENLPASMKLAISKGIFTTFSSSNYWSSSEYNATYCWYLNFSYGYVYCYNRYVTNFVRAVAAF